MSADDSTTGDEDAVELKLAHDHVAGFAKARKPILAVEELIWNALDADADNVWVEFEYNDLDGLESIVVTDDGHGIHPATREESFGTLGGSPKLGKDKTPNRRTMHGKQGRGRFRAFALGSLVEWVSRYKDGDVVKEWSIRGDSSNLRWFPHTKPEVIERGAPGTAVIVSNLTVPSPTSLTSEAAQHDLLLDLAPYLRSYPGVTITLDDHVLDPEAVIESEDKYDLAADVDGVPISATLVILEWNFSVQRRLLFCTPDGFQRHEELASIQAKHARGSDFTAYVMSDVIAQMSDPELDMGEMEPRIRGLAEAARDKLREHFKAKEALKHSALIELWKAEGTYPFEGEATPIGHVERQVFDILAVNVNERLPGFESGTRESRWLTFKLLRQALETNPSSLNIILTEVLKLPSVEQDEFAEMLQRATLSGIVKAAKVVTDRIKFLAGLRDILFDPVSKKLLKERYQLQRILVEELWVFGEGYYLGLDDQNLKALLAAHLNILGRQQIAEDVRDINGDEAIPDLMLYRQFPDDRQRGHFDHLVIELKRPSVKGGQEEIGQITRYGVSVQKDSRFDKARTRWKFVLVVNDLDEMGEQLCTQRDRPYGHVHQSANLDVIVKKWSDILQDCQWRHEFYRKKLELELEDGDGRAFVERKHAQFLPKAEQGEKKKKSKSPKTARPQPRKVANSKPV